MFKVTKNRVNHKGESMVIEVGCGDGVYVQYFKRLEDRLIFFHVHFVSCAVRRSISQTVVQTEKLEFKSTEKFSDVLLNFKIFNIV